MQRPLSQHLCHNLVTYQHSSSDFERKNKLCIGNSWQHSTFFINCKNFVLRIMVLLYNHLKLLKFDKKIWKKLCTNVCPTGAFITDAGTRNIYYGLRCLFLLLLFSISLFFGLEISIKSKSITVFLKWEK